MDWECNYIEKESPIHYDSDGNRFIIVDDLKMLIRSQEPDQLYPFKTFTIYINKMPKECEISRTLSCFKHKRDLLCEERFTGAFIMFEQGTKCTVLGSMKYCLLEGEFNKVRDFGGNKYASILDLHQIRDAFIVNQERDNYNTYLMDVKIRKIQNFLLDMVHSLSETNPSILNSYLKGSYFARPLTNDVYEVCQCENRESCDVKEFPHPSVKFCGDNLKSQTVKPFDIAESIDFIIDDQFKFQGRDIHIEESIIEIEERNGDYEESVETKSIFSEMLRVLAYLE